MHVLVCISGKDVISPCRPNYIPYTVLILCVEFERPCTEGFADDGTNGPSVIVSFCLQDRCNRLVDKNMPAIGINRLACMMAPISSIHYFFSIHYFT